MVITLCGRPQERPEGGYVDLLLLKEIVMQFIVCHFDYS